ncbi:MAG: hypothetical protein JXR70_18535 [Spirochaetales bacterium]|nr:hypothetical protein [Spirochaetales bacterium]
MVNADIAFPGFYGEHGLLYASLPNCGLIISFVSAWRKGEPTLKADCLKLYLFNHGIPLAAAGLGIVTMADHFFKNDQPKRF